MYLYAQGPELQQIGQALNACAGAALTVCVGAAVYSGGGACIPAAKGSFITCLAAQGVQSAQSIDLTFETRCSW
jgi:hypothetical protein